MAKLPKDITRKGRRHFIWKYGVLMFGGGMLLVGVLSQLLSHGVSGLGRTNFLVDTLIAVTVALPIGGYVWGAIM